MTISQRQKVNVSTESVVARLHEAFGVSSDAQLARKLNKSASAIAAWRARGTVPYEAAIEIAEEQGFSLDWLLLGRGPKMVADIGLPARVDEPPQTQVEPTDTSGPDAGPREIDPDLLGECMDVVAAIHGLREPTSRERARAAGLMYEFCRSLGIRPRDYFKPDRCG